MISIYYSCVYTVYIYIYILMLVLSRASLLYLPNTLSTYSTLDYGIFAYILYRIYYLHMLLCIYFVTSVIDLYFAYLYVLLS